MVDKGAISTHQIKNMSENVQFVESGMWRRRGNEKANRMHPTKVGEHKNKTDLGNFKPPGLRSIEFAVVDMISGRSTSGFSMT